MIARLPAATDSFDPSDPRHRASLWRTMADLNLQGMRRSLSTELGQAAMLAPAPAVSISGIDHESGPILIQAIEIHFELGALLLVENGADIHERGRGGSTP